MKAIFFEQHGDIETLKFADVPEPKPLAGEALVKVKAVALNHLDIWVRRGWRGLHLELPHITGSDVCGEIVSAPAESGWRAGTRVIINPGIVTGEDQWTRRGAESLSPNYKILGEQLPGGMAEYVKVPVRNLFTAPDHWSDAEACAPLLVGTTCWRMLFKQGDLKAGQSVLIVGAGGGVNSLAIALARAAGAYVYCLAGSKEKQKRAEQLGANVTVNYNENRNWHVEILKLTKGIGVDLVIDNVGAETLQKSLRAVTRGGKVVTVGNTSGYEISYDNRVLFSKQISLIGSTMGSKQDFIDVIQFMAAQNIRPVIDQVAPLSDGIKMIRRLEEGKQFGKLVLQN